MSTALTKAQLVALMAERMDTDKKSAAAALDTLSNIILETVAAGGAVTIPDVGKISCRDRPARMVRNPATGEQMEKEADRAVKVTVAKKLKESINA
ncbi:HU family DNA-binding protein [Loktanella sp. DJP18]|uniref:HU family DNA-binding protein n=1 Tax=Loktanella sp. DJP18 TaxID=3409788 RepID=UPI003BB7536B